MSKSRSIFHQYLALISFIFFDFSFENGGFIDYAKPSVIVSFKPALPVFLACRLKRQAQVVLRHLFFFFFFFLGVTFYFFDTALTILDNFDKIFENFWKFWKNFKILKFFENFEIFWKVWNFLKCLKFFDN